PPAAEVREPFRTVRDVLGDALSLLNELRVKRVQDALEHREIERGRTVPCELEGPLDHAAVVAGDGKISASRKQGLEMLQVRAVDFTPRPVRDVGRFLVGPFHKSDPSTGRDEAVDVFPSSPQTRLAAYRAAFVPLPAAFATPACVLRRGRG